eukprot:573747-Amphidinium_carterae.1
MQSLSLHHEHLNDVRREPALALCYVDAGQQVQCGGGLHPKNAQLLRPRPKAYSFVLAGCGMLSLNV